MAYPRSRFGLVAMLAVFAVFAATRAPAEPAASSTLKERAETAYQAEDFATCADLYQQAAAQGSLRAEENLLGSARCAARAGDPGRALDTLERLATEGFRDLATLEEDEDLSSMRSQKRWSALRAKVESNADAFRQRVHPEFLRLHEEDQADRRQQPIDWPKISARDAERRQRVDELLAAGAAKEAEDYFHAAEIFHHGRSLEDFERARELASRAVELDPEMIQAKRLWAQATDRWLLRQKKPQIYGTVSRKTSRDSPWTLEPLDADAVTDQERAAHGVPSLAESWAQVEAMNAAQAP